VLHRVNVLLLEDLRLEDLLLGEGRLVRNAREQRPEEKFATLKQEDGSKKMVL